MAIDCLVGKWKSNGKMMDLTFHLILKTVVFRKTMDLSWIGTTMNLAIHLAVRTVVPTNPKNQNLDQRGPRQDLRPNPNPKA